LVFNLLTNYLFYPPDEELELELELELLELEVVPPSVPGTYSLCFTVL